MGQTVNIFFSGPFAHIHSSSFASGAFPGIQSICTLLASTLTGWIWTRYGAAPKIPFN